MTGRRVIKDEFADEQELRKRLVQDIVDEPFEEVCGLIVALAIGMSLPFYAAVAGFDPLRVRLTCQGCKKWWPAKTLGTGETLACLFL